MQAVCKTFSLEYELKKLMDIKEIVSQRIPSDSSSAGELKVEKLTVVVEDDVRKVGKLPEKTGQQESFALIVMSFPYIPVK